MSPLPVTDARRLVRALRKAGFVEVRQTGSHLHLRHPDRSVPMHRGDLKRGTPRSILTQAGWTEQDL